MLKFFIRAVGHGPNSKIFLRMNASTCTMWLTLRLIVNSDFIKNSDEKSYFITVIRIKRIHSREAKKSGTMKQNALSPYAFHRSLLPCYQIAQFLMIELIIKTAAQQKRDRSINLIIRTVLISLISILCGTCRHDLSKRNNNAFFCMHLN